MTSLPLVGSVTGEGRPLLAGGGAPRFLLSLDNCSGLIVFVGPCQLLVPILISVATCRLCRDGHLGGEDRGP